MANQPPNSGSEALGPCLSLDELLDVLRGRRLGGDPAATHHIDHCPQCGSARAWLERVLDATADGPLPEPPLSVIERAIGVFPREPIREGRRERPSLARLVLDSLAMPLPAGLRGRSAGRRLLYDAGWADLDIEIREAPLNSEAFRVTGQLLVAGGSPPTDLIAALWSEESMALHAIGDPMGLFVFPEVPPGAYRLEIWTPAQAGGITIEPFELKGES